MTDNAGTADGSNETGGRGARGGAPAPPAPPAASPSGSFWFRPSVINVKLIYAAYLASLAIPFAAIVAVVFAHQNRKRAPAWLVTHYTYQVRTFWIGLAANVGAWILSFIGVGLILYPLIAVWVVARAVKGLIRVAHASEIEDPQGFFI